MFSWVKTFQFQIKFHLHIFLMILLTISQHWFIKFSPLQWCHNEHDGISNHWHLDCLLNPLFRLTGEFPAQRASNAENVSIWWRPFAVITWIIVDQDVWCHIASPGIILCMGPANERCYFVMSSPIGWAHTQNDPCITKPQAVPPYMLRVFFEREHEYIFAFSLISLL